MRSSIRFDFDPPLRAFWGDAVRSVTATRNSYGWDIWDNADLINLGKPFVNEPSREQVKRFIERNETDPAQHITPRRHA